MLGWGQNSSSGAFVSWGKIDTAEIYIVIHRRIRTRSDWWFSEHLRISPGSDSTFSCQDLTRAKKFHCSLISANSISGFTRTEHLFFSQITRNRFFSGSCPDSVVWICGHGRRKDIFRRRAIADFSRCSERLFQVLQQWWNFSLLAQKWENNPV